MNQISPNKWQKSEQSFNLDGESKLIHEHDQVTNEPTLFQSPATSKRPPAYVTLTGFVLLIVLILSIWGLVAYLPR